MRNINLVFIPGRGKQPVEVSNTDTWHDLIARHPDLRGRDLTANNVRIPATRYGERIDLAVRDVYATEPVKGNLGC